MTQLVLSDALRHAERLFGPKEAVVCGDAAEEVRFSYAQLGSRCRRLMTVLRSRGVGRGDRVAVLMRNCHRYLEAYFAIPGMGAIVVPMNTRHAPAEHRAILDDCEARLLIVDEPFRPMAEALLGADRLLVAPQDYERDLAATTATDFASGVGAEDVAGLFYTGGTTGAAKGVMLTHGNMVANAFHITIGFGYRADDVFLHAAPMFHLADAGSIHALTWQGACHVVLPAFEPEAVLDRIARARVTCTIGVPTMVHALAHHPRAGSADLSSLRLLAHGGAPISTDLLRRAVPVLGCSFTQAYGLTEASSFAAVLPHEETLLDDARLRSAGRAAMGVELAVRRADGKVCEPCEIGEITARGPNVTKGYWGQPKLTAETLRDGWFWTGDLAYMDADGYLFIVDRAKDMIISGGENVYSVEVEETVGKHPAVLETAVVGLPDPVWGERVHAVVVLKPGQELAPDVLQAFCRARIAGYKCPRSVSFAESLPKSGAGKVLKRDLRARYGGGIAQGGPPHVGTRH